MVNSRNTGRGRAGIVAALLLALALVLNVTAQIEEPIPSISISGNTYSNVVVTMLGSRSVAISHTRGIASFNVGNLTTEEKENLGLIPKAPPPAPAKPITIPLTLSGTNGQAIQVTNVMDAATQVRELTPEQVQVILGNLSALGPAVMAAFVCGYLFVCFCLHLICRSAGSPSPLVWVPFFQIYALYRAARMSSVWFVLMCIDLLLHGAVIYLAISDALPADGLQPLLFTFAGFALVHFVGWVIWCFKICIALGKSPALGILLLLPLVNVFVFLYLAFSKVSPPDFKITPPAKPLRPVTE